MMKQSLTQLTAAALVGGTIGCSFVARDAESYRNDTRALLETERAEVERCYNETLETDSAASGTVVVTFTVQSETGKLVSAAVDPQRTSAPEELGTCVTEAIAGLRLTPPDENDGQATFAYEFSIELGPADQAPPSEASPSGDSSPPG